MKSTKRTGKQCTKCFETKPLTEFHKHKREKDGYRAACKTCRKKEWKENREKISIQRKGYYQENKEAFIEYSRKYRLKNPDRIKEYSKKYFAENKQKINDYVVVRYHTDACFRLSKILRARFYEAVIHNYGKSKWREILGCSIEELKIRLENQFQPGMSWENYGEWHIDHIVPLCSFDLSDEREVSRAFHCTNLQPLWAADNLSKGGRF